MATTDKLAKADGPSPIIPVDTGTLASVREALEDIAGEGFGVFDFPELQIPAGGGLSWEVPTLEGTETTKTLAAVIVQVQQVRQYYAGDYTGEGVPPDCASPDGITGYGAPGGECASCPLAQWGSDKNHAQACQQRRHVLLMMEGSCLPFFLNVPPSSLKNLRGYMLRLAGAGTPYWQAVTTIELETAQNATGIKYSKAGFKFVQKLTPEQVAVVSDLRASLAGILTKRIMEAPRAAEPSTLDPAGYVTG